MGTEVYLFYCLQKVWASGTTAFTAHLYRGLEAAGYTPSIIRPIKEKGHILPHVADFGEYGMKIFQFEKDECYELAKYNLSIIVAGNMPHKLPEPNFLSKMQKLGAHMVIHDPGQFMQFDSRSTLLKPRVPKLPRPPLCVRQSTLKLFPNAIWLPHPYVRQNRNIKEVKRTKNAVNTARISTAKRQRLILKANRLLPKKYRCEFKGAEFRLTGYGLQKTYKGLYTVRSSKDEYPQNFTAPVELNARYRFNVDLSKFAMDGGGTQYAQLEAMDAGCVCIMHEDWTLIDGDISKSIVTITSPDSLAELLRWGDVEYEGLHDWLKPNVNRLLKQHDAKKVAKELMEKLDA